MHSLRCPGAITRAGRCARSCLVARRPYGLRSVLGVLALCMGMSTSRPGGLVASATALRILAVGDSLTEGFHHMGTQFHPYARKLQELVRAGGVADAEVVEEGVSGELVVPTMHTRLGGLLGASQAAGTKFDWVLILGGINDVGWGKDATTIFTGLSGMYKAASEHGARVVAMTCFEYNSPQFQGSAQDGQRAALNGLIRDHVKSQAAAGVPLFLLDTEVELSVSRLSQADAAAMWDDALHLKPAGYDRLATLLWEKVLSAQLNARPAR